MFTSFIRVSAVLFVVSLASAANLPAVRTTTYLVCAICPSVDTAGHAVSPLNGYGLTPPERFCGFGDLGVDGFITDCFYDNYGALTQGTEYCPPGPVSVAAPSDCEVVTE